MSDQEAPLINGVEHKICEVLPFVDDDYGGVIVEMKAPMDPKSFVTALKYSFAQWRLQVCAGAITCMHLSLFE